MDNVGTNVASAHAKRVVHARSVLSGAVTDGAKGDAPTMRFRLRYHHHDFELGNGSFEIGRSSRCQLSIDDPLVSRRHATVCVTDCGVSLSDLGSRNGVLVNGQRISDAVSLKVGDRISVGGQELLLLGEPAQVGDDVPAIDGAVVRRVQSTVSKLPVAKLVAVAPTSQTMRLSPVRARVLREFARDAAANDPEQSSIRRCGALSVLADVATKALAMGNVNEAERILAQPLRDVLEAKRAGRVVSPAIVDLAARLSVKLARATRKAAWVDCVIEMYGVDGRICPASVVDELHGALRRVTGVDRTALHSYIAKVGARKATLGPAERFLFQRLEGLQQLWH